MPMTLLRMDLRGQNLGLSRLRVRVSGFSKLEHFPTGVSGYGLESLHSEDFGLKLGRLDNLSKNLNPKPKLLKCFSLHAQVSGLDRCVVYLKGLPALV